MGGFDSHADDHKNHNITQSISVRTEVIRLWVWIQSAEDWIILNLCELENESIFK